MAKYSKNIETLVELLNKKNISIKTKSEKTAKTAFHKMYDCIHELKFATMMFADNCSDYCFCGVNYGPETFGDYNEIKPIVKKLIEGEIFTSLKKNTLSVDQYNENLSWMKNNASEEEFKDFYPHYMIKIGADRFGNNPKYTIEWVPESVTRTSKRNTSELHLQKVREVCQKIGVLYNCPNNCWEFKRYKKTTEYDYQSAISNCDAILNGIEEIPLCSPKQANWVVKIMGTTIDKAMKLNKYQASEILDYGFNSENFYSEEEVNKVKNFYNEILNKI